MPFDHRLASLETVELIPRCHAVATAKAEADKGDGLILEPRWADQRTAIGRAGGFHLVMHQGVTNLALRTGRRLRGCCGMAPPRACGGT